MKQVIIRRIGLLPLILLGVSLAVFLLSEVAEGDIALKVAGGADADAAKIAEVREQLGLDQPLYVRYFHWLAGALRLNFGTSYFNNASIAHDIAFRLPVTLSLGIVALLLGVIIGVPSGIAAGVWSGRAVDRTSMGFATLGVAVPSFWLASLLIVAFAVKVQIFPVLGYVPFSESPASWFQHIALPALSLSLLPAAALARQLRGSVREALRSEYVRTAWSTGARPVRVVFLDALRNASAPALTVLGLQAIHVLGGSIIIEQIFSIPGLGSYVVEAVMRQDVPVILAVAMVFAVMTVVINLLVDVSYAMLNPKVRHAG